MKYTMNYLLLGVMIVTLGGCDVPSRDVAGEQDETSPEVAASVLEAETTEPEPVYDELVSTTDTSDWKTYHNERYGYEIKIPADWTGLSGTKGTPLKGELDPNYKSLHIGDGKGKIFSLDTYENYTQYLSPGESGVDNFIATDLRYLPRDEKPVKTFLINQNGVKMTRLDIDRKTHNKEIINFLIETDDLLIIMDQDQTLGTEIQDIASTFKFTN